MTDTPKQIDDDDFRDLQDCNPDYVSTEEAAEEAAEEAGDWEGDGLTGSAPSADYPHHRRAHSMATAGHPFVNAARAKTMLRDFDRLRKAIRQDHCIIKAMDALDNCERWFDLINPNTERE